MKVGIKYCGGCQNRYNRSDFVNEVKAKNTDVDFVIAQDADVVDYLLVINGCTAACADISKITSRKGYFMVTGKHQIKMVQKKLDELKEEEKEDKARRKILRIGDHAQFSKTITDADVTLFAGVTGDFARMHVDEEFAKLSEFGGRVVHGMLALSYISTVMGMKLPGDGTIFMGQNMKFLRPIFVGDTLTAKVELISFIEQNEFYIGVFRGVCENQKQEMVLRGTFEQKMPKYYFVIEEENKE